MKLLSAVLVISALVATPALARHAKHHHTHHHRHHASHGPMYFAAPGKPYRLSYSHNYGPGVLPGTYAYYDGPLRVRCDQSAAAYRGQDGRAYPCN
ncbi:hypothetical protein [Tardiphaga sp.]|uniref:hypothetical protein n=1 Tax=Tardiphaga sp. TaxID=1926292 RepID=UPI00260E259D|nr:hypothetical protein [Tardiphaga sp.]MDB5615917.1 hypothetical protein [Tardiphaga sp.]